MTFAIDLQRERTTRDAPQERSDVFRLLSFEELLRMPDPEWLIRDLVPLNGLSVLYAPPGSFKSFVALDWGLSIGSGIPWLGHPVKQQWVVYCAAEGASGLKLRADAWAEAHERPDLSRVRWLTDMVNLRDPKHIERVRRSLAELPDAPVLVVDTMARTMIGGDENSARDVGEFIAAVDDLRRMKAALVVHHTGHDQSRPRGSTALEGAADLQARVERDGASWRLTLRCDKLKDGPEWTPLPLVMQPSAESLVVAQAPQAVERADDLIEKVLEALGEHQPVGQVRLATKIKRRRSDVTEVLKGLERAGKVRSTSKGYELCPGGPDIAGTPQLWASGDGMSGDGDPPLRGALRDISSAGPDEVCPEGVSAA